MITIHTFLHRKLETACITVYQNAVSVINEITFFLFLLAEINEYRGAVTYTAGWSFPCVQLFTDDR